MQHGTLSLFQKPDHYDTQAILLFSAINFCAQAIVRPYLRDRRDRLTMLSWYSAGSLASVRGLALDFPKKSEPHPGSCQTV